MNPITRTRSEGDFFAVNCKNCKCLTEEKIKKVVDLRLNETFKISEKRRLSLKKRRLSLKKIL